MQLSKFFSLAEMTRSETAQRDGIPNVPDEAVTNALRALSTAVLDPLRETTGAAISINSGYRSPSLNARIGGAKNSQHMEGKAADIQSEVVSVLDLFKKVIELGLPYDQVIYEAKNKTTKWVHVSHSTPLRGNIMVAEFGDDGKPRAYHAISKEAALALTEPATRGKVELRYEETGDEPELEIVLEGAPAAPAPKRPTKKRAAKRATKPRRKPAGKKPAARKRKVKASKRTTSRGKKRGKPNKHKVRRVRM